MANKSVRLVLLAGFFSQLLCLGIARFAYTPLIPLMQTSGLTDYLAGILAALNYLGYFSGALLAITLSNWHHKFYAYRAGLLLAVITTFMMGMSDNPWLWGVSRYFAGLSSAASMLLASGLILQYLAKHGKRAELGLHFAGLGLGIALVAYTVELLSNLAVSWQNQWFLLTFLALLLFIPAWFWLPKPSVEVSTSSALVSPPLPKFLRNGLFFMYFCAGYGYVVTITFIVSIASQDTQLKDSANWAFLLLGLGAAIATILWDRAARVLGYLRTLRLTLFINAIVIILPALYAHACLLLLSAFLFGFSFVGCVSLMLTLAGRLYPEKPAHLMGKMTLFYGLAQVIAPAISGYLAKESGNFYSSLYVASAVTFFGVIILTFVIKHTSLSHIAMQKS